jgi:hypothetical protein
MSDDKLIDRTVEVLGKLNRAETEILELKRLLEAARHHVEGNASGLWKFNPEGRPRAVQLHNEILRALSEYNLETAGAEAAALLNKIAEDEGVTFGPLDTPGIELRDAVGWAVFTGSEGEDPSFHAWFAQRATAEAYVKASIEAAAWVEIPEVDPPPLATVRNASFEPDITRSAAKFASSYEDPEMPEGRLTAALSEYTDDHEKQAWKDLLKQTLPWVDRCLSEVWSLDEEQKLQILLNQIHTAVGLPTPPPVHLVTYKRTLQGNFLITECGLDAGESDGRFTNHKPAVTCLECLHILEQD